MAKDNDGNFALRIAILEVVCGYEPCVPKAKYLILNKDAKKRETALKRHFPNFSGDLSEAKEVLEQLRQKRMEGKRHYMIKKVAKELKKAKTFAVQRVVRNLKKAKEAGLEVNEEELGRLKTANVQEKAQELSKYFSNVQEDSPLILNTKDPIFSIKSFQNGFEAIMIEWKSFVKDLFHSKPLVTATKEYHYQKSKQSTMKKAPNPNDRVNNKKKPFTESMFIGSLKANAKRHEGPQEEHKNRMGQRARRQLAEKLYGDKANHLKKPSKKPKQAEKKTKTPHLSSNHPSWEAKRAEAQKLSKTKFAGNKVVFARSDEDD